MADDTLSPVGFEAGPIVKTRLDGQARFAMACNYGDAWGEAMGDLPQAAFVRNVLMLGLASLGWTEEKMIEEYAAYRVRCLQRGEANPFESE
jgi:hypothetical protein